MRLYISKYLCELQFVVKITKTRRGKLTAMLLFELPVKSITINDSRLKQQWVTVLVNQ